MVHIHASAHETAVGCSLCSPDGRGKTDDVAGDVYTSATERSRDRNPDEVGETKNENSDTSELDGFWKCAVEGLHVSGESWSERQRTVSLDESGTGSGSNAEKLPFARPVERVVRVGGRLRDENACIASTVLDKVVRSDIRHDFSTGQDLGVQLGLDLVKLLLDVLEPCRSFSDRSQTYLIIVVHLHLGR